MVKSGTKTKGRHHIQNNLIEEKEHQQVTFSNRKSGLFKKASQISMECGAQVDVATFKLFAFGDSSVKAVLHCYAPGFGDSSVSAANDADLSKQREMVEALHVAMKQKNEDVKAEAAWMKAIGEKVIEAHMQVGKQFWWEVDVEALGVAKLPEFARALQRLRDSRPQGLEALRP